MYSCSFALSLVPPSLSSRASQHHAGWSEAGRLQMHVHLPAFCQWGPEHGARAAVARGLAAWPSSLMFVIFICLILGKSVGITDPQVPFPKWRSMVTKYCSGFACK